MPFSTLSSDTQNWSKTFQLFPGSLHISPGESLNCWGRNRQSLKSPDGNWIQHGSSRSHFTVTASLLTCNIKVSNSLLWASTATHSTNIFPFIGYLHLLDNQKKWSSFPAPLNPAPFFILVLLHHPTQAGGRAQWSIPFLFLFVPNQACVGGETVCQLAGQSHLLANTYYWRINIDGDRNFTCKEKVGPNVLLLLFSANIFFLSRKQLGKKLCVTLIQNRNLRFRLELSSPLQKWGQDL